MVNPSTTAWHCGFCDQAVAQGRWQPLQDLVRGQEARDSSLAASGVLKDKIRAERSAGKTFILTSHIISELEELAEDVAFLHEGRVGFAGPVKELIRTTRQDTLERAIAQMMKQGVAA